MKCQNTRQQKKQKSVARFAVTFSATTQASRNTSSAREKRQFSMCAQIGRPTFAEASTFQADFRAPVVEAEAATQNQKTQTIRITVAQNVQGVHEMTQQPCPDCLGSNTEIQDGSFFSCRDCGFSGELEAGHPYREAAEEQVYWCRLAGGFRIGRPKISTTVARAEARMRLGDGLYWCRKCSGEPPQHIKDYEKYAEVICGDCFFSQP